MRLAKLSGRPLWGVALVRTRASHWAARRRASCSRWLPLVRDVVALVDDDDVPADLLEPGAVRELFLSVSIETMQRSKYEKGLRLEGIFADAGEPLGVEAHEREREARPQLALELREHALDGDDEDAPARARA
jgi:hypothetical protein